MARSLRPSPLLSLTHKSCGRLVFAALLLVSSVSATAQAKTAPAPLAGEVPLAGEPVVAAPPSPSAVSAPAGTASGTAARQAIPQLRCPTTPSGAAGQHPGVLLACFEQHHGGGADPEELLRLAQHLEAAGLFDAAAHRWRKLGTLGGGARGLEATRRANALAELGLALDAATAGKARRGKARLRSAMQTFERQAAEMAWELPAAIGHTAVIVAEAARLKRQAKRWRANAIARRGGEGGWFVARLTRPRRRKGAVAVERCLGGVGYDTVRAAVALPRGEIFAVGEATAADGDTQLRTWLLDASGRVRRRSDFGAGGPDRPYALALDGRAGAWVVGATDGKSGSDAWFVRVDLNGRVRGHDERDGGGVDRAVAVVRVGPGRALALAEADTNGAADLWLLRLDATGKIRGDARIHRKGRQQAHGFVLQGDRAWVGGSDGAAGLLEAFDGAGHTRLTVRGALPGPVLALASAGRRGLWVVGRRADGRGWLARLDRKGRLKVQRRFKTKFGRKLQLQLLPTRRAVRLLAHESGLIAPAWLANIDRRGRLKKRRPLTEDGRSGVQVALSAGKRSVVILGAAQGCGRGLLDGWLARLRVR